MTVQIASQGLDIIGWQFRVGGCAYITVPSDAFVDQKAGILKSGT